LSERQPWSEPPAKRRGLDGAGSAEHPALGERAVLSPFTHYGGCAMTVREPSSSSTLEEVIPDMPAIIRTLVVFVIALAVVGLVVYKVRGGEEELG
jgi:hypothetical protein